jgi:hypothetical protein
MTLLPIARPLRAPENRARIVLIFLTVVYVITVLTSPKWYPSFVPGAVFLTLAIVWAPVGLSWLKEHTEVPRSVFIASIAAIALIGAVWGRGEEVGYANKHYTRTTLFLQEGGPQEAFEFTRDLKDKRIAIAGSGQMFFGQYGFYGVDRSNHVQYIGQEGDNGTYRLIAKCENYVRKINEGNYDYIITSEFTQDSPTSPFYYPIRSWIKDDPAVTEVVAEPDITPQADYVYEINGRLDPANCENIDPDALDRPPVDNPLFEDSLSEDPSLGETG